MKAAFGLKARSGWAALAALGNRDRQVEATERRRVELVEAEQASWARQPCHAAVPSRPAGARGLVGVLTGDPMPDGSAEEILAVRLRTHKARGPCSRMPWRAPPPRWDRLDRAVPDGARGFARLGPETPGPRPSEDFMAMREEDRELVGRAEQVLAEAIAGLRSRDPLRRLAAAMTVARIEHAGESCDLTEAAGAAMADLGQEALPLVIPLLEHPHSAVRMMAVRTITFLAEGAAPHVGAIASHLAGSPGDTVRALLALGRPGEAALLGALTHEDRRVRLAALRALDSPLSWPPLLNDAQLDAILALLQGEDAAVADAALALLDSVASGDSRAYQALQRRLPSLPPRAGEPVRKLLDEHRENHPEA